MALVNLLCMGSPILLVWFLAWFRPEELQYQIQHHLMRETARSDKTTKFFPLTLWAIRLVSLALVIWIIASGVSIATSIVYGIGL